MSSIITTNSAVLSFINGTSGEYSAIINRAYEIRSHVEKLYNEVQVDLDSINRQIMRGQRMQDEIQIKVDKYQALMEEADAEVDRCESEISYVLSHPITRTYTDEDGNDYTVEEIDETALAAAERARDRAYDEYKRCREKYNEANSVKYKVDGTVRRFETVRNAIEKIAQMIQNDIYEIRKYISALEGESEYNLQNLSNVSESLGAYLACQPIYMPAGTVYSDYSASSSASTTVSSMTNEGIVASESGSVASKTDISSYEAMNNPKIVSERYFNKQSKRDTKSLNYSETKNLQTYLNDNGIEPAYKKINGHLVNGDPISEELTQTIKSMTDTISNHTLKRDMILYRGMKRDAAERIFGKMEGQSIEELKNRLEGITYIERGFSSTTIFSEDALDKYMSYKGVLFEISAPCGAEGIFTKNIANYAEQEHEVLLQRGGIFSIDKISDRGDYYVVNVSLIGRQISNE